VNDTFKELEVAGWREPGRGDAYDAVVGRVTARLAEPLLDAAGVHAGTSLLDVATGTGHVAGAAAARGARAVGVDISEAMLARARRVYPGVECSAMPRSSRSRTTRSTPPSPRSCSTTSRARNGS
jgi:SAM-dependent methyltransferase